MLTVGTERGWTTIDPKKFDYLVFVDSDPGVHWFNKINSLLIKYSINIEDYRETRFASELDVWKTDIGPSDQGLFTEEYFDVWIDLHYAYGADNMGNVNPLFELAYPFEERLSVKDRSWDEKPDIKLTDSEFRARKGEFGEVFPNDYVWINDNLLN